MRIVRRLRQLFFLLIVLNLALIGYGGWWVYRDLQTFRHTPLANTQEVEYMLKAGTSLRKVARELGELGVIPIDTRTPYRRFEKYFALIADWNQQENQIKSGEYTIPAALKPEELLALLIKGQEKNYPVSLIEGLTFKQLRASLEKNEHLQITLKSKTDEEVMAAIGHAAEHPEGRFYPDTYLVKKGTTDVDLLKRAYDKMRDELQGAWDKRAPDLPYATAYDVLIMASLVEKETAAGSERPQIAGVFVQRLRKNMLLQTDPTVIYGMGDKYDGNIRKKDLETDTPYNTYTRAGLPPTPIAAAGRAALIAATQPVIGEDLYFVARGDGTHQFSPTLEAHNRAVTKFQLGGRAPKKSTPASGSAEPSP